MKYRVKLRHALAVLGTCLFGVSAFAQTNVPGTFKHITIDGSFADWAGVPIAYTAPSGSSPDAIQYQNIYIANDANNLYVRVTLYSPRPTAFANSFDNIFVDADNNAGTGYLASHIGSEMLIQAGTGYQEKNGGFNEGGINNLGFAVAGSADSTDFELTFSLTTPTYALDNTPVFTTNGLAIEFEGDNSAYANTIFAPPTGGLVYTLATAPTAATTNATLISLSNSPWKVNASGTDLGTNWLAPGYDDTTNGWTSGDGLFGYTPSPSSYPTIKTALSSGPNTYYFRTHFQFTNDTANVAFAVSNYLSDGAVYYLNGSEIRRVRMPSGAIAYATAASATNSPLGHIGIFGIDGGTLFNGDNVLEVEVHQAPASAADLVFGLSLTAALQYPVLIVNTNLPADQTVVAGQAVSFTADILGSGPLSYQWEKNGTDISGATNAIYTIPLVLTNDIGNYSLRVANAQSTNTTRAAVLTVTSTPVIITDATQPGDQFVVEGRPVTLSVFATGSALVQYQWFQGSTAIAGATNSTYTIASTLPANSGNYFVTVSNPANTTNSRTAALTVLLDTVPPAVTNVGAGSGQIVLKFSEPLDPTTANNAALYTLGNGVTVISAVLNPNDPTQVTLTTSTPLLLGTAYSVKIKGVKDLFGNTAPFTASFARTITIDGDFDDWQGVTPLYSGPSGSDGAADFMTISVFNDANFYYFYVTLWHDIPAVSGQFPAYVNMFLNTDGDSDTGYSAVGSDMLIQSGFGYQEKNGGFNEGGINGLDFVSLPASPGTNFEFSFSRAATFATDGTPVFTTNQLTFLFQGMNPSFVALNSAPSDGSTLTYNDIAPISVASLPLGQLGIGNLPGKVALTWDAQATLQASSSATGGTWANVTNATSPYIISTSSGKQFFRLAQ